MRGQNGRDEGELVLQVYFFRHDAAHTCRLRRYGTLSFIISSFISTK